MEVDMITAGVAVVSVVIGYLLLKSMKVDTRHDIKDAIAVDNATEERTANRTDVKLLQKDVETLKNK